ncbi:MAG TPA: PGPGW domain-containing protein [Pyrinomonadaceae bacterium]|nr:PGPGW domain-containing protein [Pyrinomonadaceae bacterium]
MEGLALWIWESVTWGRVLAGVGLFALSMIISTIIMTIVIVKIPANYFSTHYQADFRPDDPWLKRWGATIAKNIIGALMVLAGIVMLFGPGQGLLTILIGLILMDIPGKRPFEARIIQKPPVLSAVNRLREKFGKPPLVMD